MVAALHLAELYGEEWAAEHEFRPGGGACGYVLRSAGGTSVYFAGDTALFSDMKLIAELYQPQVAMLPIGGKFTMGPREAAIAAQWLRAAILIPMHVNTYPALRQDVAAFAELVVQLAPQTRVVNMRPGETIALPMGDAGG